MASRISPSNSEDGSINEKLDKLADSIKMLPANRKELLEDLMKKPLYDSLEACEVLGISLPSLRRAIKQGKIRTVRIGRLLRIPTEEIERLMKGQESFLSVRQTAELLNVSQGTVRSLINAGQIEATRFSETGPFRISKSEVERVYTKGIAEEIGSD